MSFNLPLLIRRRRLLGGAFSPAALFAAGEQGVWYDPSDLTSMRQLSTGATAVTAPGDPVGFIADKRLMGGQTFDQFVAAQANAVTNGDFAVNTAGWVPAAGYTITRNAFSQAEIVRSSTTTPANGPKQTGAVVSGRFYVVELDVIARSHTVSVYLGSFSAASEALFSATGTGQQRIVQAAGGTDVILAATGSGNATCTIDNIKIYEIPGNHATQSNAAQRPTYGIVPAGGRRNLLTRTEEFENAAWSKTNQIITPNSVAAPDGTTTAGALNEGTANGGHNSGQLFSSVSGTTYTCSVYLRNGDGRFAQLLYASAGHGTAAFANFDLQTGTVGTVGATATASITDVGNGWYRCSLTATATSTNASAGINVVNVTSSSAVRGQTYVGTNKFIYAWGAQLETGSAATDYQRVGTAFDVTEAGVASRSYLSFDGSDDGMLTGNIVPGTDKAQVFAGVRKLSDATVGTVAETSVTSTTQNGAFGVFAPRVNPTANYGTHLRGTDDSEYVTPLIFAAPITNVVSGLYDIAQATATTEQIFRVNGVAQTLTAVSASTEGPSGTGNFLTYPLYIGRRAGASIPLNGQIFGLILRFGTNLSAATVTQTETWLANRAAPTVVIP